MSLFAYDGRTPKLKIKQGSVCVELYNERSAYPFPALTINREVEIRHTRQSMTGPRATVFVVPDHNGAEESLQFSATVTKATHDSLRAMARANPPEVEVTYRDETWPALLLSLSPVPDELGPHDKDQHGPQEFVLSATLQRTGTSGS